MTQAVESNNRPHPCVVVQSEIEPSISIIWLHGLGADGFDFVPITKELEHMGVHGVRYVFPHAPKMPVSINGGYVMPAWYDIRDADLTQREDETGLRKSQSMVLDFIHHEMKLGIASHRIILAGFSQGGAVALQTGLRCQHTLGGVVVLSSYLCCQNSFESERTLENQNTRIFIGHGNQDQVVPMTRGKQALDFLNQHNYSVTWKTYPMAHSVCDAELQDIAGFFKECGKNLQR